MCGICCPLGLISMSVKPKISQDFWKINTYVEVLDNKKGFNGEFLIDSVVFTKDTNGTTTQLNIVNKGTYTLDIKQALTKARVNNFGNQFQS